MLFNLLDIYPNSEEASEEASDDVMDDDGGGGQMNENVDLFLVKM